MQIRKPRLSVSMSGPVTDLPPFQVEPQFLEALWRELRCAGASLEARDRALWELRILLLRFRQAPKKDSGPRTKHRDEAGAILRAMNAAIDEVVGSGNRARGRFFHQIGKCLVDADQKAVGKQTFKVVMKMFSKAATASLRQAQSRVSRGRLPDARRRIWRSIHKGDRALCRLLARNARDWKRATGLDMMSPMRPNCPQGRTDAMASTVPGTWNPMGIVLGRLINFSTVADEEGISTLDYMTIRAGRRASKLPPTKHDEDYVL